MRSACPDTFVDVLQLGREEGLGEFVVGGSSLFDRSLILASGYFGAAVLVVTTDKTFEHIAVCCADGIIRELLS